MKILVLNSGSSSLKYALFEMTDDQVLVTGSIERIGEKESGHRYCAGNGEVDLQETLASVQIENHQQGVEILFQTLLECGALGEMSELFCIGHRVVHGGELYREPTLIDATVLEGIRSLIPLAPLHNPANLMGIEIASQQVTQVPQVAVFDTAFHQSMPEHAFHYALPGYCYEQERVRRYGFHGTSYQYVSRQAARLLGKPLETLNLIILHLGNGASAAAIQQGQSIDTSMGMTPLEGLVMGTRSGDIDPAICFYLNRNRGMASEEIDAMLNHSSGLKGLCGENDMRAVHRLVDAGDDNGKRALDIYCYRIKKYIGAYYAVLGHVDALVFTGGIGENDARVRAKVCSGLDGLGIILDLEKKLAKSHTGMAIGKSGASTEVLVVPTDEEREIAIQSRACITNNYN